MRHMHRNYILQVLILSHLRIKRCQQLIQVKVDNLLKYNRNRFLFSLTFGKANTLYHQLYKAILQR